MPRPSQPLRLLTKGRRQFLSECLSLCGLSIGEWKDTKKKPRIFGILRCEDCMPIVAPPWSRRVLLRFVSFRFRTNANESSLACFGRSFPLCVALLFRISGRTSPCSLSYPCHQRYTGHIRCIRSSIRSKLLSLSSFCDCNRRVLSWSRCATVCRALFFSAREPSSARSGTCFRSGSPFWNERTDTPVALTATSILAASVAAVVCTAAVVS
mmetsp:Transcript_86687/g.176404  ORF Transcript_86687/g.176404 Transcript_86687/m.176404 type:complete len:211 (+) Transcript_86687:1408-2040(+)